MNNPRLIRLNKQISRLESKLNRLKAEKQDIVEGRNREKRFKKQEKKMRKVIQALDGIEFIDEVELAFSRRYR